MPDREPMTPEGQERLKEELRDLRVVQRPAVAAQIEEARAHGDLKENAEYHAAKEKQSFLEGRIGEIESRLSQAQVIDPKTLSGDRVMFGATVTFEDCESGDESKYQIVGLDEADVKIGKISYSSPIARALIGKSEGDTVKVRLPKGAKEVDITVVEFL